MLHVLIRASGELSLRVGHNQSFAVLQIPLVHSPNTYFRISAPYCLGLAVIPDGHYLLPTNPCFPCSRKLLVSARLVDGESFAPRILIIKGRSTALD
jgi:hypothetical protein